MARQHQRVTPPTITKSRVPDGERVYAIGDIHGRLDLFAMLIGRIRADNQTRGPARIHLVLLGDLIDRGPASAELVARCREITARSNQLTVLKGNHEAMMLDALRGNLNALALWLRSGGDAALRSWGLPQAQLDRGPSAKLLSAARRHVPAPDVAWLDALPLTEQVGDYLFVHAGIRPGVSLAGQSPEDMLWIRREFLESTADHSVVVVHGHSISEDGIATRQNRIGIDTGAYRSGVLTAIGLEGDDRWTIATAGESVSASASTSGRTIPSGIIEPSEQALVRPNDPDRLVDDLIEVLGIEPPFHSVEAAADKRVSRLSLRVAAPAALLIAASGVAVVIATGSPERHPAKMTSAPSAAVTTPGRVAAAPEPQMTAAAQLPIPAMASSESAATDKPPSVAKATAFQRARMRPAIRSRRGGENRMAAGPTQSATVQAPAVRVEELAAPPPPSGSSEIDARAAAPRGAPQLAETVIAETRNREPSAGLPAAPDRTAEKRIRAQRSLDAIRLLRRQ